MFNKKSNDALLAGIRQGKTLTHNEMLSLIVGLSIPSILAQVTNVLMFYIDAAMVGKLGATASASIGLVESATWLFGGLCSAVSLGFSVQVAHFIGANDFVKARQVMRHALVATLAFSVLVTLCASLIAFRLPGWLRGGDDIAHDASLYFLIYALSVPFLQLGILSSNMLKSAGNMQIPSIMSVLMCVLDVCFNYLFIYVAGLGVPGAALGTVLSIAIVASVEAWFALFRSSILALRLDKGRFVWMWSYVRNAVKISAPIAAQYVLMSGAQIVSTYIVAPLGNFAIAANTFAITAESLCYMPGYGIGDAATTLVGQSMGAGQYGLCRSFAKLTVGMGMAVMALMGVVMYVFAPEMIGLMTPVEEIRDLGTQVLRIEAFAEPMFAAAIVGNCVCVGAGDTLKPSLMNLASMWGVRLTLAAVLAHWYGLQGVWTAMAIELTFRGTLFLIRLKWGAWLRAEGGVEKNNADGGRQALL
jgi:MATE efflux family protein